MWITPQTKRYPLAPHLRSLPTSCARRPARRTSPAPSPGPPPRRPPARPARSTHTAQHPAVPGHRHEVPAKRQQHRVLRGHGRGSTGHCRKPSTCSPPGEPRARPQAPSVRVRYRLGVGWGKVFEALPPELSREETLFFDAVDLLIPACQLQYGRMRQAAFRYAQLHGDVDQEGETPPLDQDLEPLDFQAILLADAGTFVATVQRLRRVVKRLHGDPTLRVAKKAFERSVSEYEEARHYLEHLDTAIPAIVPTGQGALGSLAWQYASDEDTHRAVFIFPGHLGEGATATIRVGPPIRGPVDHLWLTIGGADYYLTGAADAVNALRRRLSTWSEQWVGALNHHEP